MLFVLKMSRASVLCSLVLCLCFKLFDSTPESSLSWTLLVATDGVKFSARNAHASCIFKDELWVVGGRTDKYTMYNLLDSYKVADVWHSKDGGIWTQEINMIGDYWAQNNDVVQPGAIAPWYQRYGHSLDAVDIDGDGEADLMIMLGGYASNPSNDQWVSPDGANWIYCGLAPWTERAWHSTVVFNGSLYLMGGTPLNNEVWRLDNVTRNDNRTIPLTRSLYCKYNYILQWTQLPNAPWSPRVGAGVVSHDFWNQTAGESTNDTRSRIVLAGGYGGWLEDSEIGVYDGFYSRSDSWESYDGMNWTLLNPNCTFGGRAWFGMGNLAEPNRTTADIVGAGNIVTTKKPKKIFVFGGGYIGFTTSGIKIVSSMLAKADGWWSYDGVTWLKINYEEGGGTSTMPFYSSQEWAETIVDTNTKYIGNWGHTLEVLKINGEEKFVFVAGDFSGTGDFTANTFMSESGIFCDIEGVICSNFGTCVEYGCVCINHAYGTYCETGGIAPVDKKKKNAGVVTAHVSVVISSVLMVLSGGIMLM